MSKVILEKSKCIGCGTCVSLCSDYFELTEDGKSHLKQSRFISEKEIEELEIENGNCIQEAIEACPVQSIKII